jgi:glycosyltransferase involved in cell wall biosynthesis
MTIAESTNPKISLIVAVYNAEPYFRAFIDSVLSQTFQEFELLLINDGSSDNSGAMCDEYAAKDNRIKVLHKANEGVAATRQRGLDMACGEYTIHADPDDVIAPTMLEELYNTAKEENADMVICNIYKRFKEGDDRLPRQNPTSLQPPDIVDDLLSDRLHGSLCNKLIRRELFSRYNISFAPGLNYCEDLLVCIKLAMNDIKVAYLDRALYYYNIYQNENSISRIYTRQKLEQRLTLLRYVFELLPDNQHYTAKCNMATIVAHQCLRRKTISDREFAKTFRPYRDYFIHSQYKLKRKVVLVMSCYGLQTIARLFIKRKK